MRLIVLVSVAAIAAVLLLLGCSKQQTPAPPQTPPASTVKTASSGADRDAERAKIELLIEHVGSLEGAVFIRNGREHASKEAAEHLRRKWDAAGDRIATAEQFIEEIASQSSLTGEPYRVRTKDGAETDAGDYLREQLKKIEAAE